MSVCSAYSCFMFLSSKISTWGSNLLILARERAKFVACAFGSQWRLMVLNNKFWWFSPDGTYGLWLQVTVGWCSISSINIINLPGCFLSCYIQPSHQLPASRSATTAWHPKKPAARNHDEHAMVAVDNMPPSYKIKVKGAKLPLHPFVKLQNPTSRVRLVTGVITWQTWQFDKGRHATSDERRWCCTYKDCGLCMSTQRAFITLFQRHTGFFLHTW